MIFNLKKQTVYVTLTGSRAYGTHREDSDYDYRGVFIHPLKSYLGISKLTEDYVDSQGKYLWKNFDPLLVPNSDLVLSDILKFISLCLKCNPNIFDLLFADQKSIVYCHPAFQKILEHRDLFLTTTVSKSFSGFALKQLSDLKLNRQWLLDPPKKYPERADFGLPKNVTITLEEIGAAEAYLKTCVESFLPYIEELPEHVRYEVRNHMFRSLKLAWAALGKGDYPVGSGKEYLHLDDAIFQFTARIQGYDENFLELLHREKKYRNAVKNWEAYQKHMKDRNPKRLEMEKKIGFDGKHALHTIRPLRMAEEILTTGKVNIWREDAEELKAIGQGAWSYDELIEYAEKKNQLIEDLALQSNLPKNPPYEKIDQLASEVIQEFESWKI